MTFQTVFNLTMDLVDERSSTGAIPVASTAIFKAKAPGLLTLLQNQIGRTSGIPFVEVASLDDEMLLPDESVHSLAHGLAAKLLADENPPLAAYYQQIFEETKRIPVRPRRITDVYNVGGGGY
jgi:hypothetical protein